MKFLEDMPDDLRVYAPGHTFQKVNRFLLLNILTHMHTMTYIYIQYIFILSVVFLPRVWLITHGVLCMQQNVKTVRLEIMCGPKSQIK